MPAPGARGTFIDLVPARLRGDRDQRVRRLPGGAAGGKTPVFKGS